MHVHVVFITIVLENKLSRCIKHASTRLGAEQAPCTPAFFLFHTLNNPFPASQRMREQRYEWLPVIIKIKHYDSP